MAFENVDVQRLISSLTTLKNNLINPTTTDNIIFYLSSLNVWQGDSKKPLQDALKKLSQKNYKTLERRLNSYIEKAYQIQEYQILQNNQIVLKQNFAEYENNLYYTETYHTTSRDRNGQEITETHSRTVKNSDIESRMIENRNESAANKDRMDYLAYLINTGF